MGVTQDDLVQMMDDAAAAARSAHEAVLRRDYSGAQAHAAVAEAFASVVGMAHVLGQAQEVTALLFGADADPVVDRPNPVDGDE